MLDEPTWPHLNNSRILFASFHEFFISEFGIFIAIHIAEDFIDALVNG